MRALTVRQPWASLIVNGIKDVENRTWKTNFRGRVLIHAAAMDFDFKGQMTSEYQREYIRGIKQPYTHSAIIGSVEIIDCVKSSCYQGSLWGSLYCWHWKLAHARLFPEPIPAKGKLGFWDFPDISAVPEEENGPLFCHCQLPISNNVQVKYVPVDWSYECRYCGGRWYN